MMLLRIYGNMSWEPKEMSKSITQDLLTVESTKINSVDNNVMFNNSSYNITLLDPWPDPIWLPPLLLITMSFVTTPHIIYQLIKSVFQKLEEIALTIQQHLYSSKSIGSVFFTVSTIIFWQHKMNPPKLHHLLLVAEKRET